MKPMCDFVNRLLLFSFAYVQIALQYYQGEDGKIHPETDQELPAWLAGRKFQLSQAGAGYLLTVIKQ